MENFSFEGIDTPRFDGCSGADLLHQGRERLLQRAPVYVGDILWEHLDILQKGESPALASIRGTKVAAMGFIKLLDVVEGRTAVLFSVGPLSPRPRSAPPPPSKRCQVWHEKNYSYIWHIPRLNFIGVKKCEIWRGFSTSVL